MARGVDAAYSRAWSLLGSGTWFDGLRMMRAVAASGSWQRLAGGRVPARRPRHEGEPGLPLVAQRWPALASGIVRLENLPLAEGLSLHDRAAA